MTNNKKFTSLKVPLSNTKLANVEASVNTSKLKDVKVRERPSISLKYYDSSYVSLNDIKSGNNLKILDSFIRKINNYDDWDTALRQHNVQQTPIDNDHKNLRNRLISMGIDPKQTDIIHLRASDKFRVHGFLMNDRFKLIWLDPDHAIHKK